MALQPLSQADLQEVRALQAELGAGDTVTPTRWAELAVLQPRLAVALDIASHGPAHTTEPFALIRDQHDDQPLVGPRWWFHLLGLRHGAAHVVLTTPQGWFVAQRRSREKDDAPGALDVAVSGHIGIDDPETGAWREMAEELGLARATTGEPPAIVQNALTPFDVYDVVDATHVADNPPVLNRERLWVFHAQLTADGMTRMHFADGEVTALVLLGPADTQRLAHRCVSDEIHVPGELDLALGIRGTLPRWVAAAGNHATG